MTRINPHNTKICENLRRRRSRPQNPRKSAAAAKPPHVLNSPPLSFPTNGTPHESHQATLHTHTHTHTQQTQRFKRRLALKALGGSALAGGLADKLPYHWQRPLVQSAVLPAHAQVSPHGGQIRLMVSGPGQAPQMFGFDYQLTYTTGHRIAYLNFRRGAATLITPPTASHLIEQVVPAAIAQTQALRLTRDLELNFLDERYFTQSSDLPLSYAGGECIFFNISVTLIENRTAIHQITANSRGTCGTLTIAQAPGPNSGFGTITQTPAPPTPAPTTAEPTTTLPLTAVQFVDTAINRMEGEMVTAQITKTGTSKITFDMVLITDDSSGSNADLVAPGGTPLADQPPPDTSDGRFNFTGLTIAATDTSLEIPLTLALQLATEGDEILVFELQNATGEDAGNSVGIGTDNRLVITIIDVTTTVPPHRRPVVIEFAQDAYTSAEGVTTNVVIRRATGSGTAMVTIQSIALTATGIDTADYTINFTGLGANAAATANSITNLEIPQDQDSITLPITWVADADFGDQSLTLNLSTNGITAAGGIDATAAGNTQTVITVSQTTRTFSWAWGVGDYLVEGQFVTAGHFADGTEIRVVAGSNSNQLVSHEMVVYDQSGATSAELYRIDLIAGTLDGTANANVFHQFDYVVGAMGFGGAANSPRSVIFGAATGDQIGLVETSAGGSWILYSAQSASLQTSTNISAPVIAEGTTYPIPVAPTGTTPSPLTLPVIIEFAAPTYTNQQGETTNLVIQRTAISGTAKVTIAGVFASGTGLSSATFTVNVTGITATVSNDIQEGILNIEIPATQNSITIPITWATNLGTSDISYTFRMIGGVTAEGGVSASIAGNRSTVVTVTPA